VLFFYLRFRGKENVMRFRRDAIGFIMNRINRMAYLAAGAAWDSESSSIRLMDASGR
jgi:hypothetical protein